MWLDLVWRLDLIAWINCHLIVIVGDSRLDLMYVSYIQSDHQFRHPSEISFLSFEILSTSFISCHTRVVLCWRLQHLSILLNDNAKSLT